MRLELTIMLLGSMTIASFSTSGAEFNSHFIKSSSVVDLSKFNQANYIPDGIYQFDIFFNQDYLYTERISVVSEQVCVTQAMIERMPLNSLGLGKYLSTFMPENKECYQLSQVAFSNIQTDLTKGRMDITLPQEYLAEEYKNGFVNSNLWDDGIGGVFFDYHSNYFATKQNQDSDWFDDWTTFGVVGVNAGPVRLRANYQQSSQTRGELTSYYGYLPLRHMKSKLSFGNTAFGSEIYASFRMNGVRLQSDDQMLPAYLRGYSPVISGTVEAPAVITLSQQGRVLKVVNVNPGPYVIDDLSQSSQGEIDVEIRLADGSVQRYQVNGASVQYLTRPGHIRYSLSAGAPDRDIYAHRPGFVSAEGSYGLNNQWSLFGGTLLSSDYQVYTLGSGVNFGSMGALSADVSFANTELPDGESLSGTSIGVSYNNTLTDWGLGMRVAGYRFSQEKFYEFDEYLHSFDARNQALLYQANNNKKDEQYITLTQSIANTNLFFSYNARNYWDSRRSSERYDLTVSQPLSVNGLMFYLNANVYRAQSRHVSYSDTQGWQSTDASQDENGWSVGISIPLGNSHTVSMQSRHTADRYAQTLSYAGRDNARNANYRLAFDEYEGESVGVSGNYQRNFAYVSTSLGGSVQSDAYKQVNASASGTVLMTQHGLAYSNLTAGDTRLLLDTSVPDVTIQGTGKQESNAFGLALVNGITPYQKSQNTVDYKALPKHVEVLDSVKSVVLTEGAIGYQSVRARQGESYLARLVSREPIPFGASVIDERNQEEVGLVGTAQAVYLSGVNQESELRVIWGQAQSCRIAMETPQHGERSIRLLNCH